MRVQTIEDSAKGDKPKLYGEGAQSQPEMIEHVKIVWKKHRKYRSSPIQSILAQADPLPHAPNLANRRRLSSSIVGLSSPPSSPDASDSVIPPPSPLPLLLASARLAATARRNSSSSLKAARPGTCANLPRQCYQLKPLPNSEG